MTVGERHDRADQREQDDHPDDETDECRAGVASVGRVGDVRRVRRMLRVRHELLVRRVRQATRTLLIVSFFWIFFMTSTPSTTLPKTVCTPFRCRQFAELSTMKNWLPPVSLPA